jgi:hypothetical protein
MCWKEEHDMFSVEEKKAFESFLKHTTAEALKRNELEELAKG